MKTNDLKKGTRIVLKNGWNADLVDSRKGSTRMAKVYGFETEIGSVYAHDIVAYEVNGSWKTDIEYTPEQLKTKKWSDELFESFR